MNNAQFLSVADLQKLPLVDLETFTRSTARGASRRWLMLGRCFLVLGQESRLARCGLSGLAQYAGLLGIEKKEALECKRVAACLESLPLLRAAAEAGRIGWGALCRITETATPETDARWLELAENYVLDIIKRLVEATPRGALPCEPALVPSQVPVESWLHLKVPAHVAVMFQHAIRQLSLQAGTPVNAALCQELVLAEFLAGAGANPETVEKLREEARKNVSARIQPATGRQMLLEADEAHPARAGSESGSTEEQRDESARPGPEQSESLPSRLLTDDDAPAPPFAALGGRAAICSSDTRLRLVVPDADAGWVNPRLRFSEEARLATPAQRRELLRRDGYCCSAPGCPNRLWLDLHHVVFYCVGGVTLPENLVVVCRRCHRNIHRGRLTVRGRAPGGLEWRTGRGHPLERPLPVDLSWEDEDWEDPPLGETG